MIVEAFGHTDALMRRAYTILAARVAGTGDNQNLFRVETEVL